MCGDTANRCPVRACRHLRGCPAYAIPRVSPHALLSLGNSLLSWQTLCFTVAHDVSSQRHVLSLTLTPSDSAYSVPLFSGCSYKEWKYPSKARLNMLRAQPVSHPTEMWEEMGGFSAESSIYCGHVHGDPQQVSNCHLFDRGVRYYECNYIYVE